MAIDGSFAPDPFAAPRLALSPTEAAKAMGVGRTLFYETIMPELPVARAGRRRLIQVEALRDWLEANSREWDD